METARAPYWLNHEQRTALADAITTMLDTCPVLPRLHAHLTAVLTELGVAAARDHVWPQSAQIIRQVSGYNDDVLPIRMSKDEHAAVLSIPTLSDPVQHALAGGKSTP